MELNTLALGDRGGRTDLPGAGWEATKPNRPVPRERTENHAVAVGQGCGLLDRKIEGRRSATASNRRNTGHPHSCS